VIVVHPMDNPLGAITTIITVTDAVRPRRMYLPMAYRILPNVIEIVNTVMGIEMMVVIMMIEANPLTVPVVMNVIIIDPITMMNVIDMIDMIDMIATIDLLTPVIIVAMSLVVVGIIANKNSMNRVVMIVVMIVVIPMNTLNVIIAMTPETDVRNLILSQINPVIVMAVTR
jgi:hypothetical protein